MGELESFEQLDPTFGDEVAWLVGQARHHPEVLPAGEVLVDGGKLAGETDPRPNRGWIVGDVDAEHVGRPGVWAQDGREDADGGGLAGAVRPEKSQHRAGRHDQVDAVECDDLAVTLGQSFRDDGVRGAGHGVDNCSIIQRRQVSDWLKNVWQARILGACPATCSVRSSRTRRGS